MQIHIICLTLNCITWKQMEPVNLKYWPIFKLDFNFLSSYQKVIAVSKGFIATILIELYRHAIWDYQVGPEFSVLSISQWRALHKKWSFSLRNSSINVTKSAGYCGLVTFTDEILHRKLHFFVLWRKRDFLFLRILS